MCGLSAEFSTGKVAGGLARVRVSSRIKKGGGVKQRRRLCRRLSCGGKRLGRERSLKRKLA
ncbi:hypothetical protein QPA20_001632 [Campylobacter upsaliensis]|nr:hypothetical protein [Campylobacter upsaliensis]